MTIDEQAEKEKETSLVDSELMDELVSSIITLCSKKFDSDINTSNVEFYQEGLISNINSDGTYDVQLSFGKLTSIPNYSGTDIASKNTKVKVYYNKRDMTNCYIGTVFK